MSCLLIHLSLSLFTDKKGQKYHSEKTSARLLTLSLRGMNVVNDESICICFEIRRYAQNDNVLLYRPEVRTTIKRSESTLLRS